MNDVEVRALLKAEAKPTQLAWAAAKGLAPSYVSDVLNGRRDPSPAILQALGLQRIISYEPLPNRRKSK